MGFGLLDLPGVGPRLRDRLVDHFGDEDTALKTFQEGNVADLTAVLSQRQAVSLSQYVRGRQFGVSPGEFMATEEVRALCQSILERMAESAHTDYARMKILTLFPSSCPKLIEENRRTAFRALETATLLQSKGLEELLSRVRPLRIRTVPRIKDRCIVANTPKKLSELRGRGLDKSIDLYLAETPTELRDAARGYGLVSYTGRPENADQNVESVESLDDWYLVPEMVIAPFSDNLPSLLAALEVARILEEAGLPAPPGWREIAVQMRRLHSGEDEECRRISLLLERLDAGMDEASEYANQELRRRIEASTVTLAGMDLLQALSKGDAVRELFEVQMRGIFQEVVKEASARLVADLGASGLEAVALEEVFPSHVCYPIQLDRQSLRRLEQELKYRREMRLMKERRSLAKALKGMDVVARRLISEIMETDFLFSLGVFALKERLNMPELVDGPCLGFEGGRNLFLEKPEPVSYSLGETGMTSHRERVVILSGVNSGGKTSLLDLISQIAILAHMGLPVPADAARLGIFQEMYYFGKSRGTLSAGAFETAMRKFAVVGNRGRKLVLADELESITEPGASARIIAAMLDELNRRDSVAVFVSHLAENTLTHAQTDIRVDGIEAQGLDQDNRLIVNRSPRYNYLARSTPELILDKLVRTTEGQEQEFYRLLLAKFR